MVPSIVFLAYVFCFAFSYCFHTFASGSVIASFSRDMCIFSSEQRLHQISRNCRSGNVTRIATMPGKVAHSASSDADEDNRGEDSA